MLDPRIEQELVGGGDTLLHYHLADRATNAGLQSEERVRLVSNTYTVVYEDDILLLDGTSAFTVTLPIARSRRITLIRTTGTSTITVAASSTDTINGSTSIPITSSFTPLRLKALAGVGYVSI